MNIKPSEDKRLAQSPLAPLEKQLQAIAKGEPSTITLGAAELAKLKEKGFTQVAIRPSCAKVFLAVMSDKLYGEKQINKIISELTNAGDTVDSLWKSAEYYQLLLALFGASRIDAIYHAWQCMPQRAYQTGYYRRSFRMPNNASLVARSQLRFLVDAANPVMYAGEYYALDMADKVRLSAFTTELGTHAYEWAAMLDGGDKALLALMHEIITEHNASGAVSRDIIRALLSTDNSAVAPKCWQLVENLLLSAQRQEGLRQAIMEALDEASLGAMIHIMRVVLEHKLTRFSAVVRAFDVWTGMGWEGQKQSTVDRLLATALTYFDHLDFDQSEHLDTLFADELSHKDNAELYMALWVLGCIDVERTLPYIERLLGVSNQTTNHTTSDTTTTKTNADKQCLALYFLHQLQLPALAMPYYQTVLRQCIHHIEQASKSTTKANAKSSTQANLQCLAFALTYIHNSMNDYYDDDINKADILPKAQRLPLFEQITSLIQATEDKRLASESTFTHVLFGWLSASYDVLTLYRILLGISELNRPRDSAFTERLIAMRDGMPLPVRENLTYQVLRNSFIYSYQHEALPSTATPAERAFALKFITDKGAMVANACSRVLEVVSLDDTDMAVLRPLFAKKSTALQKRLLTLTLAKPSDTVLTLVPELLNSKDSTERTAGLELATGLQSSPYNQPAQTWLTAYQADMTAGKFKPTKAETAIIDRLNTQPSTAEVLSADNGWGLYDPQLIPPYTTPVLDPNTAFAKATGLADKDKQGVLDKAKTLLTNLGNNLSSSTLSSSTSVSPHPYGLSKLLSAMRLDLKALQALIVQHKDHEYTREYSDGQKETVLLGNSLHASKNFTPSTHDEAGKPLPQAVIDRENRTLFEHYPLWQVWDKWYQDAGWTPLDLFLFNHIQETNGDYDKPYLPAVKDFVFVAGNYIPKMGQYNWNNPIITVLHALTLAYPYHDKNSYLIGATQAMFASFGDDILQMTVKYARNSYTYNFHGENGNGWQAVSVYNRHLKALDLDKLSDDETGAVLALYRFWQYAGKTENIKHAIPPLQLYIKAYGFGLIDDNEMTCDLLLTDKALQDLTDTNRHAIYYNRWIKHALADNPKLVNLLTHIINYCLDIELTRGEIDTPVSRFVAQFGRIEGIDRLVALIDGLGKTKLYASYIYEWNGVDKRQLFSLLINNCHPRSDESQADFDKAIKHACATNPAIFSEQKLIEIAIYAQQWQTMISAYLGWQGLDSGIWWLKAHTKTTSYQEISSEDESEIAKLSSLEIDEFKIGAVDKEWFEQAYKMLGKARWEMLYDSAKYVSDGNGHRRAKIYSDVLTGDLKIREVTAKVKDKRDQEYLRVYGLVPLSRTQADTDVLNRYLYLQQFLKESRQFGSQRQASEATAVQVAMDNLARNAGYADPQRLGWAMESKALQRILAGDTEYHADNVSIRLMIDDDGVAQVVCEKDGKPLKAVPAKYKKAPEVVALTAHKKTLTEQARRAKKGLEEAMIRGDVFTQAELQELLAHPVIGRLLDKLLFISVEPSPSVAPSFDFGHALVSTQDSTGNIADNATGDITDKQFRLAHCTDLHTHKVWREYQQHCFDKQLRQPFKQIFRELYLPTADELQAVTVSSRYAGHQVNPKQTAALLKSRGWRVDYETGLQKVYHKQGFFVKLYAVADWFSPADVESPTLETMEFHHLKTHEAVPFDKIEPRIFSEIMRDVDLVVSVAHVGGVDPETSQSSIEMRAVIMTETARLFKLNNVIIKGSHARITGTLGNYSLHLGSGTIHQDGRYLSVIAVQSQHRGRVFLPFIDDDPKTAEIISKMLLLARDNEIKDPTILRQMG